MQLTDLRIGSRGIAATFSFASAVATSSIAAVPNAVVLEQKCVGGFTTCRVDASAAASLSPLLGGYFDAETLEANSAVRSALGENGIKRLTSFQTLKPNWDGRGAKALDLGSLRAFLKFFSDTGFSPAGLSVFLTPAGILSASWPDSGDDLYELEFLPSSFRAFRDADDSEREFLVGDIGTSALLRYLSASNVG
ncbi:MAG: hypothetical protein IV093_07305 [Rubrivivax sp.]|nr:hypothetical protein [Rubrivivax sp.]